MTDFIKKNIFLIILFIITLSIGFLTFLTFIDKGFIKLTDTNLQYLLIINILLLTSLFVFIFFEIRRAIKTDIDKDTTSTKLHDVAIKNDNMVLPPEIYAAVMECKFLVCNHIV